MNPVMSPPRHARTAARDRRRSPAGTARWRTIELDFCFSGLQEIYNSGLTKAAGYRGGRRARGCRVTSRRAEAPYDGKQTEPEKGTSLNFKVGPEFKKE